MASLIENQDLCCRDYITSYSVAAQFDSHSTERSQADFAPSGIEDAVNNAINLAGKTIRNMNWFEVVEVCGHLENNKVGHWQVTMKVGFTLDK